ncbi:MAG TPA: hypothetical protein VL400_11450, partial [Polyangiaceae bacterium]|nr:hypothetical protein [Polyangiaceae bacterium]
MSWALVAFMAVGGAGCAGGVQGADDEDEVSEATASIAETDAPEARGMHRHFRVGPGALFQLALKELDLTKDQQTKISEALATLEADGPKMGPPDPKALAAAIRSGSVDATKLEPEWVAPTEAEIEAHRTKLAAALEVLHSTLTDAQRTTLVASAKEKLSRGPELRGGRPGGPPDGPPDGAPPPDGARGPRGEHG